MSGDRGSWLRGVRHWLQIGGIRKIYAVSPDKLLEKFVQIMDEPEVGILAIHQRDLDKLPPQLRAKMMDSVDPVVIPVGPLQVKVTGSIAAWHHEVYARGPHWLSHVCCCCISWAESWGR